MEKGNDEVDKLKSKFVSAWHNVKYSKWGLVLFENRHVGYFLNIQSTITQVQTTKLCLFHASALNTGLKLADLPW